jgi:hypothetical protein
MARTVCSLASTICFLAKIVCSLARMICSLARMIYSLPVQYTILSLSKSHFLISLPVLAYIYLFDTQQYLYIFL